MSIADAARKTVRRLSDRVDRPGHTMPFGREPGGFMHWFDVWRMIRDAGWPEAEQRGHLKAMQDSCMAHRIITAEELAAINTKYGVTDVQPSQAA
jgi:hypothetical protein